MMLLCRWSLAALLCLWALEAAATGQVPGGQGIARDTGEVEVLILAPDGSPGALS